MELVRIDVRDLLPRLRAELITLLGSLTEQDWSAATACPGWSVHGIASHLLGVEIGNVSIRRDGWGLWPAPGQSLDEWLDGFNQQWVEAARRISPALLTELLDVTARRFEESAAVLDLDATGGPVDWATGPEPAPVWLDVAREYMERFVHQYQIRDACGRPQLGGEYAAPVVHTAVHALPRALSGVSRPAGTVVSFIVDGRHGSAWHVRATADGWQLGTAAPADAACLVRTSVDGAIRTFVRDSKAPPFTWDGDRELAEAVAGAKAILGRDQQP
jgi:uncharacterized protein (TIGR03083 family)